MPNNLWSKDIRKEPFVTASSSRNTFNNCQIDHEDEDEDVVEHIRQPTAIATAIDTVKTLVVNGSYTELLGLKGRFFLLSHLAYT